jgi:hypothetical protein
LKNPDYVLVHGAVTSFNLATTPYAWAKKGNKIYDAEHDTWYDFVEWERSAIEEDVYGYEEVVTLVDLTAHTGPWSKEERKRANL